LSSGVGGKKVDEEQRIGQKRLNSMRGTDMCVYVYIYMYIYIHIYI
jgi:hypothetical protein